MLLDGFMRRAEPERPANGTARRLKLGLALGGGAARGWAHLGVLEVLDREGIRPDVIAGCSIGAVVGGCWAAGKTEAISTFAHGLTKRRVMGLLDFHIGSGLIGGHRLRKLLELDLGDLRVENLPVRFASVATELVTGHEIWLTQGPLVEAMRASYALPGVFDPVRVGGRWLMDGALVNPVPVTLARAFGADIVICVNLNNDVRLRGTVIQGVDRSPEDAVPDVAAEGARWPGFFPSFFDGPPRFGAKRGGGAVAPGLAAVMIDAFNITQDRISRARLERDPPDCVVGPDLATMGQFEFHRAAEGIAAGHAATRAALPRIRAMIQAAAARA